MQSITKSVKVQYLQLGNTDHCKTISAALVQMKLTTGALERQQQGNPQKGNDFADGGHRPLLHLYSS